MIEVTYKTLGNPMFGASLMKLAQHPGFAPKAAYNIARILDKVAQHQRDKSELHKKIVLKYTEVAPDGSYTLDKEPAEKQVAFKKEFDEFLEISVKIERYKLKLGELEGVGLTPGELLALEPVLSELELVEGGADGKSQEKTEAQQKG